MFARRTGGTFLAALLVLGLGVSQAPAEDREDARQREAVERAKVKPNDAADIARKVVPDGRVLEVDVETIRGTVTYAVEIEKDRDIRTVLVDLERGEVLSVRSKNEDEEGDDDDDDDDDDR
jgi:uncharacterized membrane protein YkoI